MLTLNINYWHKSLSLPGALRNLLYGPNLPLFYALSNQSNLSLEIQLWHGDATSAWDMFFAAAGPWQRLPFHLFTNACLRGVTDKVKEKVDIEIAFTSDLISEEFDYWLNCANMACRILIRWFPGFKSHDCHPGAQSLETELLPKRNIISISTVTVGNVCWNKMYPS